VIPAASTARARSVPERTAPATAPGRGGVLALRSLRAPQWAHFALLPAAAVAPADVARAWPRLALAIVAAAGALAWAYVVNAIADRHHDAPEKNPLAAAAHVPGEVLAGAVASAAIALAAAAALGRIALALVACSLAAGYAYSAGPRLKSTPVLGIVANTAIFATLAGIAVVGAPPPRFWALACAFSGLLVQNQLVHELADAGEDAAAGAWTTGRWLGVSHTHAAIWLATLGAAVLVLATGAPVAGRAVGVCGVAAGGWIATRGAATAARRRHRAVALATGAALWLGIP
jgi:4-hydroxybenzoate polyprenyltransferase